MKSSNLTRLLSTLLLVLCVSSNSWASTLYISDKIYVPVRKGQGNQYEILHRGLPTGTELTLLKKEKEWTKVSTKSGLTGWVRNQYLDETPPASSRLVIANQKLASASNQLKTIQDEKQTLKSQYDDTLRALKSSEEKIVSGQKELNSIKTISASAIDSHQRLQLLAEKMNLLQTENDVLKSENENLKRSERTTFFLYGVFTLLMGILVAVIVPKLRGRKRNNGWLN